MNACSRPRAVSRSGIRRWSQLVKRGPEVGDALLSGKVSVSAFTGTFALCHVVRERRVSASGGRLLQIHHSTGWVRLALWCVRGDQRPQSDP